MKWKRNFHDCGGSTLPSIPQLTRQAKSNTAISVYTNGTDGLETKKGGRNRAAYLQGNFSRGARAFSSARDLAISRRAWQINHLEIKFP